MSSFASIRDPAIYKRLNYKESDIPGCVDLVDYYLEHSKILMGLEASSGKRSKKTPGTVKTDDTKYKKATVLFKLVRPTPFYLDFTHFP